MASESVIRELKHRHGARLLAQPGVSGVGIEKDDEGGYVLAVHLDSDDPALRGSLPERIEGHPVRYAVSGPFRKLPAEG
jgi:hypothetical protein